MVKGLLLIGPTMVDSWKAIESAMVEEPNYWFSLDELRDFANGIQPKTLENMVRRAGRSGVLLLRSGRGNKQFQLAKEYTVAVVLPRKL